MISLTARGVASKLTLPPLAKESLKPGSDHMMHLIAFHDLYGVPMQPLGSDDMQFSHMDDARVALRLGLIAEEFRELLSDGFGITANITYDVPGLRNISELERAVPVAHTYGNERSGADVADALGDLVYVIYGFALEMGFDLRDVIEEIHASNLTKLGEDGNPIYREDGKVLKGPNYIKPNIRAALGMETD